MIDFIPAILCSCSSIVRVAYDGDTQALQSMLDEGIDVKSLESRAALIAAVYQNQGQSVSLLLKAGIDPNQRIEGRQERVTGSVYVRGAGYVSIKDEWRLNSADYNVKATVLMVAAKNGYDRVLATLIAGGASLELKDSNGWTALMYAASRERPECVKSLLQSGANPNASFFMKNYAATSKEGKVTQSTIVLREVKVLDIAKPQAADILKSYGALNGGKQTVLRDDFHVFDKVDPQPQNK
jgi:ankyrin repeat protein